MSFLVTGRAPFPLAALRYVDPADSGDVAVIERSIRLGPHFHGLVQLKEPNSSGLALLRQAGWKPYVPPRMRPW